MNYKPLLGFCHFRSLKRVSAHLVSTFIAYIWCTKKRLLSGWKSNEKNAHEIDCCISIFIVDYVANVNHRWLIASHPTIRLHVSINWLLNIWPPLSLWRFPFNRNCPFAASNGIFSMQTLAFTHSKNACCVENILDLLSN